MRGYYPVMLKIEGRRAVVVGGGAVAERKVSGLLGAGAEVLVVSPRLTPRLELLAAKGAIRAERRPYVPGDLAGAALAFAASDSRDVNAAVTAEAGAAGIPVNAADAGEAGTFITPAVVRRGDLIIAVSATGAAPGLAARLAGTIDARHGEEWEAWAEWLGRIRRRVMDAGFEPGLRTRLMRAALDVPEGERSGDKDISDIDRRLTMLLAQLSGGMTDESGAEAADDRGRNETERAGADPDGPGD